MTTIDTVRSLISEDGCTVAALCENGKIYTDFGSSVRPLFRLYSAHKAELTGCSVADRVIGKAAAALLADAKVKRAHGFLMSKSGLEMLVRHGVEATYAELCDYIENRDGTDLCPMEKTVFNENDPSRCAALIGEFIKNHNYKER